VARLPDRRYAGQVDEVVGRGEELTDGVVWMLGAAVACPAINVAAATAGKAAANAIQRRRPRGERQA
jgi:hypothetical protein